MTDLQKCRAENAELNALFDLQRTRTAEAEKLWQEATNNPGTLPDLGTLLEWFMAMIAELEEFNSECEDRFKLMESDRDYSQSERLRQKCHRKWALKEMYMWRALWRNYCGEVNKQMAEVEKLKRIVQIAEDNSTMFEMQLAQAEAEVQRLREIILISNIWHDIPCCLCGYSGPGYFNRNKHTCVKQALDINKKRMEAKHE